MTDEFNNEVRLEKPVEEQTVEAPKPTFDGLSNRAALEESLKINREGKDPAEVKVAPTTTEVKQAVQEDLDAPSGFSKDGVEAWKRKDIPAIQKEYRRIYDARTVEITRAQSAERKAKDEADKERGEAKTWRELGKMAAPYIEARGAEGVSPDKAIMEALALINEFKKGDPGTVKAELRKIGIDLDKAPGQPASVSLDPKIEALHATVEELKQEREQEKLQKTAQTFDAAFVELRAQKNRTGEPVFPDLLKFDEDGNEFARRLGSRTSDPYFRSKVLERFPDADFTVLVREAYKAEYGRVSGEPVQVSTQSNQQHIQKSRRASAATPGRIAPRVNDSNLSGKLSKRAALIKAMEIHREH